MTESNPPASNTFGQWLVAHRWILLALGILLGVAATFFSPPLLYDRSIENMFAPNDPVRTTYQRLTRRFAANEIILAVYDDPNLFAEDGSGLKRLKAIGDQLADAPGVESILSLAVINESLRQIDVSSLFQRDSRPPLLRDSKLATELRAMFRGFTHGKDQRTVGIACLLTPRTRSKNISESSNESSDARRATVDAMRDIMQALPGRHSLKPGMITGEPVMVADGFRFVEQDGQRLTWFSTALVALCIAGLFRSLRWMLIPLAVVQLALALSYGVLALTRARMTLVSSMMAALLTVISVAATVHIIVAIRREMNRGCTAVEAMRRALSRLAAPIIWSAITDAVGFASLMVSDVGPVSDYGRIMTIGSLLVLPAIFLLTPGLALLGNWDQQPNRAWGEGHLDDSLAFSSRMIQQHPRGLVVAAMLTTLLCIGGVLRLQLETDFTRSFRQNNPIVQAYAFVEERLGGAGVWDMMLPAPPTLNEDYLKRVGDLQDELKTLSIGGMPGFTKVLSLYDGVEVAGNSAALRWAGPEGRAQAMALAMPQFFNTMRTTETVVNARGENETRSWIRVMLRSRERQESDDKQQLIAAATEIMRRHFPATTTSNEEVDEVDPSAAGLPAKEVDPSASPSAQAELSGFFVLLSELVQSTIRDQWRCFGIAAAGMGITLTIALRSIRLALFALITNMTPVLAVLGITGWLGIRVNLGVAMIAAVSLGLSVDSSLHYLFEYRRQTSAGATVDEALAKVQQGVGRAMLFSTLSLVAGFLVLTTSPFIPTVTFGWLTALAMIGGAMGNLVILPVLLSLTRAEGRKSASD